MNQRMTATIYSPPKTEITPTSRSLQPSRTDAAREAIRHDLVHMTQVSRAMLADAMTALRTGDTALSEQIIECDTEVDILERCIEERTLCLVAAGSPAAYDLRFVGVALKVSADIERVADHAVNIARVSLRLHKCAPAQQTSLLLEIERMGELTNELLKDTAQALARDDADKAQWVIDRDDDVDVLYHEAQSELRARMRTTPAQSVGASHLLFVAHYLERVGDHCANACERLQFLVTGRTAHE